MLLIDTVKKRTLVSCVPVLGRVSMELIIIDLTNLPDAAVGDEVVCWGKTPSIDEVATAAGRVSYELFTAAGRG